MSQLSQEHFDKQIDHLAFVVKEGFDVVDRRFDQTDKRFDTIDERVNIVEHKLDRALYHELNRQSPSLKRLYEKYERHFKFLKSGYGNGRTFKLFRVLTVTYDQDYMLSLRKATLPIGGIASTRGSGKPLCSLTPARLTYNKPIIF